MLRLSSPTPRGGARTAFYGSVGVVGAIVTMVMSAQSAVVPRRDRSRAVWLLQNERKVAVSVLVFLAAFLAGDVGVHAGLSPPVTERVSWVSDLEEWPRWSVVGAEVVVSVRTHEPVKEVVVTAGGLPTTCEPTGALSCSFGGELVGETCSEGDLLSPTWMCTAVMDETTPEGELLVTMEPPRDGRDNAGAQFSNTVGTDSFAVKHDLTSPVVTDVSWYSHHPLPQYAQMGDTITVDIIADEPILLPGVTLAGTQVPAEVVVGIDDNACYDAGPPDSVCEGPDLFAHWQANYVLQESDDSGNIEVAIASVVDGVGNVGAGVPSQPTDITFDNSVPEVASVTWSTDNTGSPLIANPGTTVTVLIEMSEATSHPVVLVGQRRAQIHSPPISQQFTATALLEAGDSPESLVSVEVAEFFDAPGNAGVSWEGTLGTDGSSSVTWDETAPTIETATWLVDHSDELTVRARQQVNVVIEMSEPTSEPVMTIFGQAVTVSSSGTPSCVFTETSSCSLYTSWTGVIVINSATPAGDVEVSISSADDEATNRVATHLGTSMVPDARTSYWYPSMKLLSATFDASVYRAGDVATITIVLDGIIHSATASVYGTAADASVDFVPGEGSVLVIAQPFTNGDLEGSLNVSLTTVDEDGIISSFVANHDYQGLPIFEPGSIANYRWAAPTLSPLGVDTAGNESTVVTSDHELLIHSTFDEPVAGVSPHDFEISGNVSAWDTDSFYAEPIPPESDSSREWIVHLFIGSPFAVNSHAVVRLPRAAGAIFPSTAASNAISFAFHPKPAEMVCACCEKGSVRDGADGLFDVTCRVLFSLPVTGFDASDIEVSSGGLPVTVRSFVGDETGHEYEVVFNVGVVYAALMNFTLSEAARGVYPSNRGTVRQEVDFVCVGERAECTRHIFYFTGPAQPSSISLDGTELHGSSESAADIMAVTWSLHGVERAVGSTADIWPSRLVATVETGILTNVEVLDGADYYCELRGIDANGYVHSVLVNVNVIQTGLTSPAGGDIVYAGDLQHVTWIHSAPAGLFVVINVEIRGDSGTSVVATDVARVDEGSWIWPVEPKYAGHAGQISLTLVQSPAPIVTAVFESLTYGHQY